MPNENVSIESSSVIPVLEYLLEVRQSQLSDNISEASRQGDREWISNLRSEVDQTSQFLQRLRATTENESEIIS
jgi:hypothetical protein